MYGENAECFMEGMIDIFAHLGGVPTEIWFDNTSTLVTKILKDGGRQLTDKFLRFSEHYGFRYKFMNPESGWEKGNVGEQGWIQPQELSRAAAQIHGTV